MKSFCVKLGETLKTRHGVLPALCYAVTLLVALSAATVTLLKDTADRRSGTLTETKLSLEDFELVNLRLADSNVLISENEDPQMRYTAAEGQRLDTLTISLSYDRYPYERCLYYVTRPGEEFGQEKRVWATENADGSLTFQLPAGVLAIRLDPGSCTDLTMTFDQLVLNRPRPTADYYLPTGGGWFFLLVLPGLAAAAIQWIMDVWNESSSTSRKKKPNSHQQEEQGK